VAILEDGEAIAIWRNLSNATSRTDLLASHFTAATDWSDPVAINEPVGGMVIGRAQR
jgi:hypothetical protein